VKPTSESARVYLHWPRCDGECTRPSPSDLSSDYGLMKAPLAFQSYVSAEYGRWGKLLQENHIAAAD